MYVTYTNIWTSFIGPVCHYELNPIEDTKEVPFEVRVLDNYKGTAQIHLRDGAEIDCSDVEFKMNLVAVRCADESAKSEPYLTLLSLTYNLYFKSTFQSYCPGKIVFFRYNYSLLSCNNTLNRMWTTMHRNSMLRGIPSTLKKVRICGLIILIVFVIFGGKTVEVTKLFATDKDCGHPYG